MSNAVDLNDLFQKAVDARAAGNPNSAAALLRQVVSIQPDVAAFQLALSIALVESNDLPGAEKAADKACSLAPESAPALFARASARRRLGKNEPALSDMDAALALNSQNADYHAERALILHTLKRFEEAKSAIRVGLVYAPKSANLKRLARQMLD